MRFQYPLIICFLLLLPLLFFLPRRYKALSSLGKATRLLRITALGILILTLAGPMIPVGEAGVGVAFLMDMSESLPPLEKEKAFEAVSSMHAEMGEEDAGAIMVFGRETRMDSRLSAQDDLSFPLTLVDGTATDLEAALTGVLPLFPEKEEKRIVLFSDGLETQGSSMKTIKSLKNAGISVFPVVLGEREMRGEVSVSSVSVPSVVREGEPYDITVTINSSIETFARLIISLDGSYLGEDSLSLAPGSTPWTYSTVTEGKGIHFYRVELYPSLDTRGENNLGTAVTRVTGKPGILVVTRREGGNPVLQGILENQGMQVRFCDPGRIPQFETGLLTYDTIIFDDVPAHSLSWDSMERLETFTRLGGGFLMIGGPNSFGPGEYFATPVERLLPVAMDAPARLDIPPLSLVMVIDKSGSMGGEVFPGVSKLDLVKEAVMAAVDVLNPFYTLGVLAFDADYRWAVPMTEAGRKEDISRGVGTVTAGGGTLLYPVLEEAFRVLMRNSSEIRHVILLSDGQTDDTGLYDLVESMAEEGITVSVLGVGENTDKMLLEGLALRGRGRWYYTDNPEDVPSIFVTESRFVARNLMVEEPFIPRFESSSEILAGLEKYPLPGMEGFVLTYRKDQAELLLSASRGNPLLTVWRYGLGRSAAFTSDLSGRWSEDFLGWEGLPVFLSQLVRFLSGPASSGLVQGRAEIEGDRLRWVVDVMDEEEEYVNLLDLGGIVRGPGEEEDFVVLAQTAPGRYEASLPVLQQGLYILKVYHRSFDDPYPVIDIAASPAYPDEFIPRPPDITLLRELARETGGRELDTFTGEKTGIFDPSDTTPGRSRDLRVFGALVVLLLFLLELVLHSSFRKESPMV
ncbi:MAG: VWA domain-containing protein [Spirochaetales bacterium]|nr:VWA domain-containing protein [Spirochaetales bacterium]